MAINNYGDQGIFHACGKGADIATERVDDLDALALGAVSGWGGRLHPVVWDLGAGRCAQSLRFVQAGAIVEAVDLNVSIPPESDTPYLHPHKSDFRDIDLLHLPSPNLVFSQRSIHYLSFSDAVRVLTDISKAAYRHTELYLSASGLYSELSSGSRHLAMPLETRFAPLAPDMQQKHGITANVCLYSESDMTRLLQISGWQVKHVFTSGFGNIKVVGARRSGARK